MAQLYDGVWRDTAPAAEEIGDDGRFRRIESPLRSWIQADPDAEFPAEAGRYHVFVAWVCPWASRVTAVRVLKGLEEVISMSAAAPTIGREGWIFEETIAPFEAPHPLYRVYQEHDAHYTGKATVPTLWDKKTGRIVNNESADIVRMLNGAFDRITGNRLDLYPEHLRGEIDRWNDRIYPGLNNGVYRAGFASTQSAYEEAARDARRLGEAVDKAEWFAGPQTVNAFYSPDRNEAFVPIENVKVFRGPHIGHEVATESPCPQRRRLARPADVNGNE